MDPLFKVTDHPFAKVNSIRNAHLNLPSEIVNHKLLPGANRLS